MDELIAQLTGRVGLSPEQARQAVETVLGFVKGRLPASIATQLDAALAGGEEAGGLGGIAKGLGGLLGG